MLPPFRATRVGVAKAGDTEACTAVAVGNILVAGAATALANCVPSSAGARATGAVVVFNTLCGCAQDKTLAEGVAFATGTNAVCEGATMRPACANCIEGCVDGAPAGADSGATSEDAATDITVAIGGAAADAALDAAGAAVDGPGAARSVVGAAATLAGGTTALAATTVGSPAITCGEVSVVSQDAERAISTPAEPTTPYAVTGAAGTAQECVIGAEKGVGVLKRVADETCVTLPVLPHQLPVRISPPARALVALSRRRALDVWWDCDMDRKGVLPVATTCTLRAAGVAGCAGPTEKTAEAPRTEGCVGNCPGSTAAFGTEGAQVGAPL